MSNEKSRDKSHRFKIFCYIFIVFSLILILIAVILWIFSFSKLLILTKPGQLTDAERFWLFSEILYYSVWGIGCMITGSVLLIGSLKLLLNLK